jgi:cytoskeletal protein CcmA (bactofilin family)
MWKRKEEERPAVPSNLTAPVPAFPPKEVRPVETPKPANEFRAEVAHIGKSVVIKGELSGSEDLYLDGEVEGTVELRGHSLTVGPNGRVRASVQARDIVAHGKLEGNLHADRVELKKSSIVVGDVITQRILIEDGAFFKGSIDIQHEATKAEPPKREAKPVAAATASSSSAAVAAASGSVLDPKR